MESTEQYVDRKRREIELLQGLTESLEFMQDADRWSVEKVIEAKFRLAAHVKVTSILSTMHQTETRWHRKEEPAVGPYRVRYGYQRFDAVVSGPPIYEALAQCGDSWLSWTAYTSCGMSAVASVIFALRRATPTAEVHVPGGAYFETVQLLRTYTIGLKVICHDGPVVFADAKSHAARILIVDSFVPSDWFRADSFGPNAQLDLIIFDTTCFSTSSGRIRSLLAWAEAAGTPVVLVRSHIKTDVLGTEYGRLGSAVVALPKTTKETTRAILFRQLAVAVRDAVKVIGAAPLMASLPPFTGHPEYRALSRDRQAHIIRSSRRLFRSVHSLANAHAVIKLYQHGLFLEIIPHAQLSRKDIRQAIAELLHSAERSGLPLYHAGSFGFDFVAVDEFFDVWRGREAIRISPGDLPASATDTLSEILASWLPTLG